MLPHRSAVGVPRRPGAWDANPWATAGGARAGVAGDGCLARRRTGRVFPVQTGWQETITRRGWGYAAVARLRALRARRGGRVARRQIGRRSGLLPRRDV